MQSWQFFDANWLEQVTHMPAAHGGACYFEDYAPDDEVPKNNATYRNWNSPYQLEAAVADGRCLKADTLEELAAKGYDENFNKVPSRLMPVDTAPFYANMSSTAIMPVCIGGLESDADCHTFFELTDGQGRQLCGDIIKGLYVAGNMQGGRFGLQYPIDLKGVSHAMAMYYGRVAGENAVNGI